MINIELEKLGFKLTKRLLPIPFHDLFNKNHGEKSHRYLTHNKRLPNVQKHTCI